MVSISFFVLLLATYCYSVPVNPPLDSPTPDYEFTTGKTIVDHDNKINMHLMSDEESTGVPNIHNERSLMLDDKYPVTTDVPSEHDDHDHDHMTRMLSDPLFPSSTMESSFENDRHNVNFFPTTMESSIHFNNRAMLMTGHKEISGESGESKHGFSGDSFEATTNDDSHGFSSTTYKNTHSGESHEQPSSGESFGKTTGLLKNKPTGEKSVDRSGEKPVDRSGEKPVDRSGEKPVDRSGEKSGERSGEKSGDRSGEESTTLPFDRKPIMTKTEIIYPTKITETKIYGKTRPVVEKEKSDN